MLTKRWKSLTRALRGNLVIYISNVTSLASNVVKVLEKAGEGLHVVTETRYKRAWAQTVSSLTAVRCKTHGKHKFFFGSEKGNEVEATGVAICAGPEFAEKVRKIEAKGELKRFEEEGRVGIFEVTIAVKKRHKTDKGEGRMYIIAVYGQVNEKQVEVGKNDRLLEAIEKQAYDFRDWPIFITGDFNKKKEDSSVMMRWIRTGSYIDINAYFAAMRQEEETQIGPADTNIDFAWCNAKAHPMINNFSVIQNIFATHGTMRIDLSIAPYSEKCGKGRSQDNMTYQENKSYPKRA